LGKPPRNQTVTNSNTYFITANADGNRALFQSERVANLFIATMFTYRDQSKFYLHEFVIMPNHVHVLLTIHENTTLERAVQLIKGGFSFRAKKELGINSEIWQRGYVDHRVRDVSDYVQHRNYIHANPVRAGLANTPDEFRFSSASDKFVLDAAPQGLKPSS
jgi:putative transposase